MDLCSEYPGLDPGPGEDPWNGHVLGRARSMGLLVAAVIGADDDEGFSAHISFIQLGEQHAEGLVRAKDHAELFRRKPSVDMSHVVGGCEVDEEQAEILR